jgi:type I restriction enzyme S subunit
MLPIPPLEVQCEIVQILDDFTEATENLKKELEVEMVELKHRSVAIREAFNQINRYQRCIDME